LTSPSLPYRGRETKPPVKERSRFGATRPGISRLGEVTSLDGRGAFSRLVLPSVLFTLICAFATPCNQARAFNLTNPFNLTNGFNLTNPMDWPVIPLPEVETDPNGGTTYGVLLVVLQHAKDGSISDILAPDLVNNGTMGIGGFFRYFAYPSSDTQWYVKFGAQRHIARARPQKVVVVRWPTFL
jgi:hypothetical protein